MMALQVTHHAIERYLERVALVRWHVAEAALRSPAIQVAAAFGAPLVRLAGGQRVVIHGEKVITVLPKEQCKSLMIINLERHEARQ